MKKQNKYREQLQQRSIQPSEAVWEQLSKQLDAHDNLQKKGKWFFLKYAAIILVIASAGFYFFQPKSEIISEEKTENPASKESVEKEPIINLKNEILIADAEEISAPVQPKREKENFKVKPKYVEALIVFENEIVENKNIINIIETKTTINAVANNEVTNVEIEQLLKNAKIKRSENHQNLNKKSVSAQSLLVEVEDDLDKDLKDKLLQTIVTTLKTPREITISDRGN